MHPALFRVNVMEDTVLHTVREHHICIDYILLMDKLPSSSFIKSVSVGRDVVRLGKYLLLC